MGITHAEFWRLLPRALDSDAFVRSGTRASFDVDGGKFEVSLDAESIRQIALMKIATTPVTLTFTNITDEKREALLLRFDRAYQRGGG